MQLLKKYGLSEAQYNILRVLRSKHSDKGASIAFLKDRMLDKSSDVSRVVDRLYEKSYVNRKENPADRRQKMIEITKKGSDLLAEMYDCEKKVDTLLSNLNKKEVSELNRILDKIRSQEIKP